MPSDKIKQAQIKAAKARSELRLIDEQMYNGCLRRALQVIAKLKVTKDRCVPDRELQRYKVLINEIQERKAQAIDDFDLLKFEK